MIFRTRPVTRFCWQLICGFEFRPLQYDGSTKGIGVRLGLLKIIVMPKLGNPIRKENYQGWYFNKRFYIPEMHLARREAGGWSFSVDIYGYAGPTWYGTMARGLWRYLTSKRLK